jgi:hypothetical protein
MRVVLIVLMGMALLFAGDGPSQVIDGKAPVTFQVPYRLTATKHILVRARINNRGPFNVVLDTGAPVVIFARKIADSLQITPDDGNWADLKHLEFEGDVVLENLVARFDDLFQLEGMNGLGLAGTEIHGLIGYPILARFRIEYDFTKPKLQWTPVADKVAELPTKPGKTLSTGGLNALAAVMKGIGKFIGADQMTTPRFRGFVGLSVSADRDKLRISEVVVRGPAELAGIKVGDVILRAQDRMIASVESFGDALSSLVAGQPIIIRVSRDGVEHDITITTGQGF